MPVNRGLINYIGSWVTIICGPPSLLIAIASSLGWIKASGDIQSGLTLNKIFAGALVTIVWAFLHASNLIISGYLTKNNSDFMGYLLSALSCIVFIGVFVLIELILLKSIIPLDNIKLELWILIPIILGLLVDFFGFLAISES